MSALILLAGVFVLDYFYYYKMLVGSVNRAYAIDTAYKNKAVQGVQLFGLSTEIRDAIGKPHRSKYYVWAFYGLFVLFGIAFILSILFGYVPVNGGSGGFKPL
jgi:hypothetical protein